MKSIPRHKGLIHLLMHLVKKNFGHFRVLLCHLVAKRKTSLPQIIVQLWILVDFSTPHGKKRVVSNITHLKVNNTSFKNIYIWAYFNYSGSKDEWKTWIEIYFKKMQTQWHLMSFSWKVHVLVNWNAILFSYVHIFKIALWLFLQLHGVAVLFFYFEIYSV